MLLYVFRTIPDARPVNVKFFNSEPWTISLIVNTLKIKHISSKHKDFNEYLKEVIPRRSQMPEERKILYNNACADGSIHQQKLRSFLAHVFPPVPIRNSNIHDLQLGDVLPQFSLVCKGTSKIFQCNICAMYEKKRGLRGKSLSKEFIGVKPMYDHGVSKMHRSAVQFINQPFTKPLSTPVSRIANERKKRQSTIDDHIVSGEKLPRSVPCQHIFDMHIVAAFQHDQKILRMTSKTIFNKFDQWKCTDPSHENCSSFDIWKDAHPDMFAKLQKQRIAQAEYVHSNSDIKINGKLVSIRGAIKSIFPPCLMVASPIGSHPHVCENCFLHKAYLSRRLAERSTQVLPPSDRIGKKGMRNDYLTVTEEQKRANMLKIELDHTKKVNKNLRRTARTAGEWYRTLQDSIDTNDANRFFTECLDLFRQRKDDEFSLQMLVLKNLVTKIKRGRNHQYSDLIRRIGKLHKNVMGPQHYHVFKVCMVTSLHNVEIILQAM